MMDHHGPTVRLPTKIPRLLLVHLFVAALLTVESSSSSLSSALLLIPADSQRPAPISSRPPSPDEAAANSIDTSDDESVRLEKVSVLSGRTAELPCDISPPPLDSLYLVLWYKNNSDFPIYKYDARRSRESYRQQQTQHDSQMLFLQQQQEQQGRQQQQQQQTSSIASTASRVHFQFDSHPEALLLLNNVGDHDEGIYRCRVDFGRSPTRNVLVQLTVVVPPGKIRIIEDNRQVSSVIGPYDEGAQLSLNCIVTGGRPRPEVSWWLDNKLVDHTYIGTSENVVQNVLVIPQLQRHHLHAILRCQASNYFGVRNNTPTYTPYPTIAPYGQQPPHHSRQQQQQQQQSTIVSSVQLDLNLRPVWVAISGTEKPLSAGKSYTIECATGGSRPSANIHWYLHSIQQQAATERVTMDGRNTTSTLKLIPSAKDHDAELICSAFNPVMIPASGRNVSSRGDNEENHLAARTLSFPSSVETRRKLVVHFAPTAELELGRNLKPDSIVEGNDVYFECRIRCNPPPHRILWTHEGQNVRENSSAGVLMVEQSLVIRRVSRLHSGRYSCTAINTEGTGLSNTVQLRVMYQPICRPNQKFLYGVAKQETAVVRCQTDAIPPANSHRWAFNTSSSSEMTELTVNPTLMTQLINTHTEVEGAGEVVQQGSVFSYSPQSDRDYGSLLCWARNDIGEQRDPCVYRIFLGVRPDPPTNCSVVNQTADAIEVWCRPGFDGGQSQQFQFEIFDTQSAVLLYNKSGRYPHLRVGNLESGLKLFIQVSAFNPRGRSALVPLEAYTIKIADKQTVIMETTDLGSVLGIASGVSASVLMICIAIGLTARFRHQQTHQNHPTRQHPHGSNNIREGKTAVKSTSHHHQNDPDMNPDILINGNSAQEQQLAHQQELSTQWNHRNTNSAVGQQPRMNTVRTFSSNNGHHHPSPHYISSAAVGANAIEVVTIKTPHRQNEIPETSI
ncbi:synaptogenesis protein syg-2-like isoform X1 [Daphnia pulicaria]|uniref:synaptogenesis protein syg-2-like isoform X1 n=1 Tax=Daphnia pulicaria TaxID=35523 RepID=UPI001EEACDA9|nr:synaptogenesis protein syg-2-like isoform X1 [Daphnia pulicaria]